MALVPRWLEELGYARAPEEEVRVQLAYLSRFYRREPRHLDGRLGEFFSSAEPGQLRGGAALAQEGDRFIVTLGSYGGVEIPTRAAEMADFADSFSASGIAEIIRTAEPLSEPVLMHYPASIRRYYERLDRFPDGYLVFADAFCSFNPNYSQGMTVAALEALLLSRLLREHAAATLHLRFFPEASALLATPWDLLLAGDLRFPFVDGERTDEMLAMGEYLGRYRAATEKDAVLGKELLRVINMLDEPSRLFDPELEERVNREAPLPASGR